MEVDKQFIEFQGKIIFLMREIENRDKIIVDLRNNNELLEKEFDNFRKNLCCLESESELVC